MPYSDNHMNINIRLCGAIPSVAKFDLASKFPNVRMPIPIG